MENYFKYLVTPLKPEDVDIWFRVNNIIPEKLELFLDFCISLNSIVSKTYLGNVENDSETNIKLTDDDNKNHFSWCWKKNLENFDKEGIFFHNNGEHFDYLNNFFEELFYNQKDKFVRDSISNYLDDLFDIDKTFTKYDLETLGGLYKSLNSNLKI